jgi:hypothetical protein
VLLAIGLLPGNSGYSAVSTSSSINVGVTEEDDGSHVLNPLQQSLAQTGSNNSSGAYQRLSSRTPMSTATAPSVPEPASAPAMAPENDDYL